MKLLFRRPTLEDVELYFRWANDDLVRENSYDQKLITFEKHLEWFKHKLDSPDCNLYLFFSEHELIGQARIENKSNETIIGISIDSKFRGTGVGSQMLDLACDDYSSKYPHSAIIAYIKENNIPSYKIFKKAKFENEEFVTIMGVKSIKLSRTQNEKI